MPIHSTGAEARFGQWWVTRYLVVDTRHRWRGGKQVPVATQWIDSIDWADRTVFTTLMRGQVESSPAYESAAPITREYKTRLHDAYDRRGYCGLNRTFTNRRAQRPGTD